ncbi:unnamed protein product [Peniophora sp. CBMAI 1063]|nr:unnamed protein product [Peniophora sp. CBMAI 1063]
MWKRTKSSSSWNGDDDEGFSRRQNNAHKISSINYPGLEHYTRPNLNTLVPPSLRTPPDQPLGGLVHYQTCSEIARGCIPKRPRAFSAPASFPFREHKGKTTNAPTSDALLSSRIHPSPGSRPHQRISCPSYPERYKSGKWCWACLPEAGQAWVWAWVPNIPPYAGVGSPTGGTCAFIPDPGRTLRPHAAGSLIVKVRQGQCHDGGGSSYTVLAADVQQQWKWLRAWVPNIPPGPPLKPHNAWEWAHRSPPSRHAHVIPVVEAAGACGRL